MDASQALADLTEISSQIEAAVLFDDAGAVLGSTLPDGAAAEDLVPRPRRCWPAPASSAAATER